MWHIGVPSTEGGGGFGLLHNFRSRQSNKQAPDLPRTLGQPEQRSAGCQQRAISRAGWIDTRDYITVYTESWVDTRVPLADKGMMRYLGIHWDMLYTGKTILNMNWESWISPWRAYRPSPAQTTSRKQPCNGVSTCPCCISSSLRTGPWYQKISACIKRILGLYQSYPKDLLYLPGNYGGNGWLRFSDVVHIAKLAILNRVSRSGRGFRPTKFERTTPYDYTLYQGKQSYRTCPSFGRGGGTAGRTLVHTKDGWWLSRLAQGAWAVDHDGGRQAIPPGHTSRS